MVYHYRTEDNNYLCNPIIKANESKMVFSASLIDCEDCLEKLQNYLNKKPNPSIQTIQTNLLMLGAN